jgi:ribonuclease HI
MKKQKNHFYVVWIGRQTGIYNSWEECKKLVDGFEGARYKGFATQEEARLALADNPFNHIGKNSKPVIRQEDIKRVGLPIMESISVDAACSGNPGVLEYRGVYTLTGEEIFHRGPFPEGTTNIGEFLAIVTGLAWMHQRGIKLPLYSDSKNGLSWVKQKRVNTKLERTAKNNELFNIIEKALDWLHNNSFENKLLKWETAAWGEIPADFGRK